MKTAIQEYESIPAKLEEFARKHARPLMEVIADPDLQKLLADLGGLLDSIGQLPVFSVITAPFAIEGFFFMKKLRRFLSSCESVSPQERLRFIDSLEKEKKCKRVGEITFMVLQKLDEEVKATLLGNMFQAYIKELIDFATFRRLSEALVRIMTYNLTSLMDYYNDKGIPTEALQDIAICGLAKLPSGGMWFTDEKSDGSSKTDLGHQFVKMTKLGEELKNGLIDDYGLY